MPHFQIKLLEGKTDEQKQRLATEIVKVAREILGYGEESFSVAINDCSLDVWKKEVYPEIMKQSDELFKQPGYKM